MIKYLIQSEKINKKKADKIGILFKTDFIIIEFNILNIYKKNINYY